MSKTIEQIKRLMVELGMDRLTVVQRLNLTCAYQVSESEFEQAMEGAMLTPKAKRVLIDALRVLNDTLARRLQAGLVPGSISSRSCRTTTRTSSSVASAMRC